MKRKGILSLSLLAVFASAALAQSEKPVVNLSLDSRIDFQQNWVDSKIDDDASGFKGKYFNIKVNGFIGDKFSYDISHRINKWVEKGLNFFDATDWVYASYMPTEKIKISAGKQVVDIGGYEYDRAPIDIYYGSEFWNNIACYQFGVSGSYDFGKDRITFQALQSPFHAQAGNNSYGYSLMWNGKHGFWSTIWSVNLFETTKNHYINYIALGNKFDIDRMSIELDLMNRGSSHGTFFFRDCSLMCDVNYAVTKWLRPFVKFTYDVNRNNTTDFAVLPGTEMKTVSGGIEGWPLNKGRNEVRLHGYVGYAWGNDVAQGTLKNKSLMLNFGVKWRVNLLTK